MLIKQIISVMAKITTLSIPQSAVIPYRIQDGKLEILLITSSGGKRWIIPKGMIEIFMKPHDSAAKEAWEEAGVVGEVSETPIGTYSYKKSGCTFLVEVFALRVDTVFHHWPEAKIRKREWLSYKQAIKRIEESDLKQILLEFPLHIMSV
ncbi:NUDIX hydrolase [[Phormidium ambiguum] IAM M-71]|nr:NUDIX hydrolase [Phormidium ambiguum]